MRSAFKKLIQYLLSRRLKKQIRSQNLSVVLVMGGVNRSLFRDIITEQLRDRGFSVACNTPGYNYRLGIPLQVLGFSSGYQSIYKWLVLVFKPAGQVAHVQVIEFAFQSSDDLNYIFNILQPKAIVVSDKTAQAYGVKDQKEYQSNFEDIIKACRKNIMTLGPDDLAKLNFDEELKPAGHGDHYINALKAGAELAKYLKR